MFRIGVVIIMVCGIFSFSAFSEPVQVEVIQPVSVSPGRTLELSGSVEAKHDADLAVQQAGLIHALHADFGDKVTLGQKLLELDASLAKFQLNELEAAVTEAEIRLTEASRLYKEVLALSKTQVVAETLIAERKAALAAAQATLRRQQAGLGLQQERVTRHTVFAPFDGVIAQRNADIGEWVQPQMSVFNLVSNTDLRLRLSVPQEFFGQLQPKVTSVRVTPDGSSGLSFDLKVDDVVAVSDPISRTFTVLVNFPAHQQLIAGMSANAVIQLSAQSDTLLWLPKSAVKAHPDGGSSVFSVSNNRATRHIVTVVERRNNEVAVKGAPAGPAYVAKGVELLKDQDAVNVRSKP